MMSEVNPPPKKRQKLETVMQPPQELLEVITLTSNGQLPQRSTSGAAGSSGTTVECAPCALCAPTPTALRAPTQGYNAN